MVTTRQLASNQTFGAALFNDPMSVQMQKLSHPYDIRLWIGGAAFDLTGATDMATLWNLACTNLRAHATLTGERPAIWIPEHSKIRINSTVDHHSVGLDANGAIIDIESVGAGVALNFDVSTEAEYWGLHNKVTIKGAWFMGRRTLPYGVAYTAGAFAVGAACPYLQFDHCEFWNLESPARFGPLGYIITFNECYSRYNNYGISWPQSYTTSGEGIRWNGGSLSNNNYGFYINNVIASGVNAGKWGAGSFFFQNTSIDYNVQGHWSIPAATVQENDVISTIVVAASHIETGGATTGIGTGYRMQNFGSLTLIGNTIVENDATLPTYWGNNTYPGRLQFFGNSVEIVPSSGSSPVLFTGNGEFRFGGNTHRYGGDLRITDTLTDRRSDLQLADARIQLATTTTPLIRDGVMYLATYPGVVTGTLANQAARQANYTALQAAADYADSNGLSVHVERYTFQFEGGRTDANGVKLGLQFPKGCRGVLGSDGGGAIFAQYDPSHAGVTLGTTIAGTGQVTYNGYFKDWAVENRGTATIVGSVSGSVLTVTSVTSGTVKVGQAVYLAGTISSTYTISSFGTGTGGTGTYNLSGSPGTIGSNTMLLIETTTAGIIFGSHSNGHFERLGVSGFSTSKPWVGAKFVSLYGFFSNILDGCRFAGGALSMLQYTLNSGTGCVWNNTYIGGGGSTGTGPGHYCVGPVVDIDSGGNNGIWNQLNIEWVSSSIVMRCRATPAQVFNSVHIEGCQLSGASPTVFDIIANSTPMKSLFNGIRMENVDIRSTGAGGKVSGAGSAVSIFRISGGACFEANTVHWFTGNTIAAGSYGTCDINLNLLIESGIVNGSFGQAAIRQFFISWSNSTFFTTSGIDLDATLPRGTYGIVNAFSEYIYSRGRSQTRSASVYVPVADTNFTTYGAHRLARIRNNSPITADRKIIISDKISASGVGSTSSREPGDPILVFRDSGCTGAFNLLVRDNTDTTSVATLASASTEAFVSWNGTTVTTS